MMRDEDLWYFRVIRATWIFVRCDVCSPIAPILILLSVRVRSERMPCEIEMERHTAILLVPRVRLDRV
jgi:hypothetical protein